MSLQKQIMWEVYSMNILVKHCTYIYIYFTEIQLASATQITNYNVSLGWGNFYKLPTLNLSKICQNPTSSTSNKKKYIISLYAIINIFIH